ncbi:hypothetical protein PAXRUDRAFT_441238 [Paxillus rubicundulus Ve08.2h10]|uniref:Uncharacterized protein n=1 Tax=Paxillus rubicundulus Ve08.2h10 TaxID=930991 RepID=A0A0D0DBK3_9AGAM|nr:hypothetical protein PAXRUDRAFT_441238 [Paxillus rubicundulus Ve08.2h10]
MLSNPWTVHRTAQCFVLDIKCHGSSDKLSSRTWMFFLESVPVNSSIKFVSYISCRTMCVFSPVPPGIFLLDKHYWAAQYGELFIYIVPLPLKTHFQRYNGATHEGTPRKSLRNPVVNLTGHIRKTGEYPVAYGGFSDVWRCRMQWNQSPTRVRFGVK